MAGKIIGIYGPQRSGKTLLAYMIAENARKNGVKVYSNINCEGFVKIKNVNEMPFNNEKKVLLVDEAYFSLDSRNWTNNRKSTIFFNTIGKMNILLILTAISPDMLDVRLRRQHDYVVFVIGDSRYMYYRIMNNYSEVYNDMIIEKNEELFKNLRYDHEDIPGYIEFNVDEYEKIIDRYTEERKEN